MFKSRDGKTMRKRDFGLLGEWADSPLKFTAQLTPQGEGKKVEESWLGQCSTRYWPRTRYEVFFLIYGLILFNI